ncbi:acyl-CoA synthetase (AMP-forming)/AMP-acid ligase II [Terracoccus luteus]|uniref:Acyl-CoA synthetase (AMP-forming)/AMP-acid ligase II n=1 Tax=Terracoccus luteus TaxID=53356 RepID=A0A495XWU8_9MICO|nr:acyl-CoA synthetase (AMP-forming)/AMP-acid ligase II [Terracoccus luteus]
MILAPSDVTAPDGPVADGVRPATAPSHAGLADDVLERLPGVDARWSRYVDVPDTDGTSDAAGRSTRRWHVLDNRVDPSGPDGQGTVLAVHGNPTWSYLWRRLVAAAPRGWRVVAVDQLGMGFSERTAPRTLAQRVDDLGALTAALGITGPVVTVAHDWGGPVSLGWALAHREQLRAVVLTNTAVHQPAGSAAPGLIRLARTPGIRQLSCVVTPTFVRATTALSRPPLPAPVRDAFAAPYDSVSRRVAVGDFVADIPFEGEHESAGTLDTIAEGVRHLDVPALLLWGPRDPVFTGVHLADLRERMPHADVHRYEGASHLVVEDAPRAVDDAWRWITATVERPLPDATSTVERPLPDTHAPLWQGLLDRAGDPATAVVELGGEGRRIGFDLLEQRVRDLAAGLVLHGVRPGHRVALLVPPGADLTLAVYACWQAGASVVVADAGLGLRRMGRALRGARPDHLIAIDRGLAAAAAMRVPGARVVSGPRLPRAVERALGVTASVGELVDAGRRRPDVVPTPRGDDAECAVLFTSGATGAPKGVVYRGRQLRAQLAALRATYGLTADDRLVAAFAPFALYGPALGLASAVPDMDVTAPATLTATALADAVAAVEGTVVFASPAALRNVVHTASSLTPQHRSALAGVRLLMSAGAPVPASLLHEVAALVPQARLHTPYGMTECLPVADISLAQIDAAGHGDGVCVGHPVPGVTVALSALDADGRATGALADATGTTGEICVRADHVKDRYDQLWATEADSSRDHGWHRTGDVGHLDDDGRLWVEGRLVHVVTTADGPLTPVGPEQRVEAVGDVALAAFVGVGPVGTQQPVVVVTTTGCARPGLADADLARAVRGAAAVGVAAVLVTDRMPVDIRHASKIDRARVARWAERVLAGERVGRP